MGTPRKINAILLNIKINRPKLVSMCRYKLAIYWQNFTEIYLTRVKILQKVLGELLFFDSHCMYSTIVQRCDLGEYAPERGGGYPNVITGFLQVSRATLEQMGRAWIPPC